MEGALAEEEMKVVEEMVVEEMMVKVVEEMVVKEMVVKEEGMVMEVVVKVRQRSKCFHL